MDDEDKDDIIKKVKTSGKGDEEVASGETEDTGTEDQAADTGEQTTDTGDENQAASDEMSNDENNLFEVDVIDEMSLNDEKTSLLVKMYDEGNDNVKRILTRIICFEEMLGNPEKNRKRFLKDLEEDYDNEEVAEVLKDLKSIGAPIPEYFGEIEIKESLFLANPPKNNMFQEGSNDILDEKDDRCTRIAKRKYDVWPSAYASGAVVKCRQGKIWKNISEEELDKLDMLEEKWSQKYKNSIDCNNPKGFSQKAFCQGKKK